MATLIDPDSNQVKRCWPIWRSSSPRPSREKNSTRLSTNDAAEAAVPIRWPTRSSAPRANAPPTSSTKAPSSGRATTSQSRSKTPPAPVSACTTGMSWAPLDDRDNSEFTTTPSVLQQAGVVDRGRASGAEDGHDDREADHDLGSGHHHHEEGGDLAVEVAVLLGERDQREVRGVEHQLDA